MAETEHAVEQQQPAGVLGDGALKAGKGNMALVRRAIRERWPVSEEVRARIVSQMDRIVDKGKANRDRIGAAKVLVAADALNARREAIEIASEREQPAASAVTVNVGVSVQSVANEILNDAEYLDYLRTRAIDRDAGAVRANGQPRALADGSDARPDRPGRDGHDCGQNGNGAHR